MGDLYNECLNIDLPKLTKFDNGPTYENANFSNKEHLDKLLKQLFLNGQYWQTFITGPFIKDVINADKYEQYKNELKSGTNNISKYKTSNYTSTDASKFVSAADSNYLFITYHPENIQEQIRKNERRIL